MTREQILDINKNLFKLPRYKENFYLRSRLARRMFKLRKEISEDVQTPTTHSLSKVRVQG